MQLSPNINLSSTFILSIGQGSTHNLQRVQFDSINLILGAYEINKKVNYLNGLIISLAFKQENNLEFNIIDSSNTNLFTVGKMKCVKSYTSNLKEVDEYFLEINKLLDERKNALVNERIQKEELFDNDEFLSQYKKIFIIVDDFGEFNQGVSRNTKAIFERIIRKDKNLGIFTVVMIHMLRLLKNYKLV
jgi:hypothetical protein